MPIYIFRNRTIFVLYLAIYAGEFSVILDAIFIDYFILYGFDFDPTFTFDYILIFL